MRFTLQRFGRPPVPSFFPRATAGCAIPPPQNATELFGIPRWKRVLDVTAVILLLPVVLPLALGIAVLIRLVSRGPIIFKQERMGYRCKTFMCLKFRTMVVGADTTNHQGHLDHLMASNDPMVKLDARGDTRIIPFGLLLRSAGLDELPQLMNVLRGEMSLVGPRPCLAYEFEKYLPWQRERFNTLPGLTGLWQVSGKNRTTFSEMMHLDIDYVRRKSLWLDVLIIVKTIPAVAVQMWDLKVRKPRRGASAADHRAAALQKTAVLPPAV